MARRMSNKDRIQKAAEEAKATKKAKKKKTAAKAKAPARKTTSRAKKVPARVRMKIVWAVCSPTGKILKVFAYPEKDVAEKEAARLTKSKKSEHKVRPEKVPMEDD